MEKKGNKLIGLFDAQAQVLIQVGELRAAGYEEEELYLVSKHDEQINLLIEHTGVHVDTQDRDNFKGKVIAFLAGEDITKDAFNRMGLEAEETDHYFRQVENGKLLLYTDSEPAAAPRPDAALPPGRENDSLAQDAEEQRLALHEEQLSINKEKVQTGEVQVQKKMVEEDREVQVPVEREEIVIDRLPLSAETDAEKDDQVLTPKQAYEKGEAIYIPLSEERLDIGKKKVVREEIVIGKRKVKDVQVINQTVRREVADVEENGNVHKTNKP